LLGKNRSIVAQWTLALQDRSAAAVKDATDVECRKWYVARVQGRFPTRIHTIIDGTTATYNSKSNSIPHLAWTNLTHSNDYSSVIRKGEWKHQPTPPDIPPHRAVSPESTSNVVTMRRQLLAYGYWITDAHGRKLENTAAHEMTYNLGSYNNVHQRIDALIGDPETEPAQDNSIDSLLWLHVACPVRVVDPKKG
jgi:hypothetical protein